VVGDGDVDRLLAAAADRDAVLADDKVEVFSEQPGEAAAGACFFFGGGGVGGEEVGVGVQQSAGAAERAAREGGVACVLRLQAGGCGYGYSQLQTWIH